MVTKKNIYHYIVYVIFALIFFCSIGLYSVSLSDGAGSAIVPMLLKYAIVFVSAALIILLYKTLVPKLPEKFTSFELPVIPKLFETLGVVFSVLIMIFLRIMIITSQFGVEINNTYYEYAIGSTTKLPDTTFASFLYANICKLLLNIHKSGYPIYAFNTILHIAIAVLSYYTIKRAFRMRYAILSVLLIAFLPKTLFAVLDIGPDVLLTFLFVVYFYALVRVNELNVKQKVAENFHLLLFVGLGVLAGFISSFDIIGVSLLLVSVSSLLLINNRDPWNKVQNKFIQALIFTGTYLVSLFAFLYIIGNNGMRNFENVFNYIYSFIPDGLSLTFIPPMEARIEGIVIFIFAIIAILAFIRNELDKGLFFCIIVDFAIAFTFVNFNTVSYAYLINYLFIVIAVIGFFSVPSFIISPEEEYEREEEKRKREEKRRKREFQRDLASGNAGLSLTNSDYMGNKEKSDDKKEEKKEEVKTKEVEAAPQIPERLRPPVQLGYDKKHVVKKEEKPIVSKEDEEEEENLLEISIDPVAQKKAAESIEAKAEYSVNVNDQYNVQEEQKSVSDDNNSNSENSSNLTDDDDSIVLSNVVAVISDDKQSVPEDIVVSTKPDEEDDDSLQVTVSNPVYPDITVVDNNPPVQSKIIPSRRDYKTAHVYSNAEEEKQHDIKMAETDAHVNNQDATLKATPMIKNPLPGPKPHIAKELTFDYELKDDEMDFDIKDLTGKDYYDI